MDDIRNLDDLPPLVDPVTPKPLFSYQSRANCIISALPRLWAQINLYISKNLYQNWAFHTTQVFNKLSLPTQTLPDPLLISTDAFTVSRNRELEKDAKKGLGKSIALMQAAVLEFNKNLIYNNIL
jgi:hypothetical protein